MINETWTCPVCNSTKGENDWCNRKDCPGINALTEESLLKLLGEVRYPYPRSLDGDVSVSCQFCGRPPPEEPINCREFTLGAVGRPNVILLGLWSNAVLIKLEGVIESALLTKEEAHALASRLHRYAEELP